MQKSANVPVVQMLDLAAQLNMNDGPARIDAPRGAYNYDTDRLDVAGPVNFAAADGYHMRTNGVVIDIKDRSAVASGGVKGAVPTGTFSASTMKADLDDRTVTLEGNARLHMTPGKLRIPQ